MFWLGLILGIPLGVIGFALWYTYEVNSSE